ncbi:conserved oligomeric Golgi complex subunit 8 isoform X2 [Bombina bombina]|uniref:conserved oligomeric Golgi complex subunit 8 isoform X2 n=1 Tax=Bombina bombina TaxID=8345 RepID=UPI00235A5826|nr:conserved oligomeric Golgi complex subunit 8 isoform X2 [Bombina bombina]
MSLHKSFRAFSLLLSRYSNASAPRVRNTFSSPRLLSYWTEGKKRSYLRYIKRSVLGSPKPPYPRVTQTGDPVLRCTAAPVSPDRISHPETLAVLDRMVRVLQVGCCVGLSAPQLGVPLRILALQLPETLYQEVPQEVREAREMTPFPLQIFINPQMRVLDSRILSFPEGCSSVQGFSAVVPRYYSVEISGLNPQGEHTVWQAKGWAARIIQHEMDHLDGVLYIDKMDSRTFVNVNWIEVND